MPFENGLAALDGVAAIHAVNETLRRLDARLVDHGDRVAFIACELCEAAALPLDEKALFLLSVFHDIGAYKTDEIDRMLEFETHNVWNHSIYGYLFLKHLTPLSNMAGAVLYHHAPWAQTEALCPVCSEYAGLLHLADRIDILSSYGADSQQLNSLKANSKGLFRNEYVALFFSCYKERRIFERLSDGSYRQANAVRIDSFDFSSEQAVEFLKMIAYSIDFRSEHTVTHTINTVSIALNIAHHFGLETQDCEKIYLGALLHDVGKIAIPLEILESPGRLTPEQMAVMRTHVIETEQLIEAIVPEDICQIAVRHHEKLDGSGYPRGLTGADLNLNQRIVAVADIVSALGSRRSYKEAFPKEKTLSILQEMRIAQLDGQVCDYVSCCYNNIMQETDPQRSNVIKNYKAILVEFEMLKKKLDLYE